MAACICYCEPLAGLDGLAVLHLHLRHPQHRDRHVVAGLGWAIYAA